MIVERVEMENFGPYRGLQTLDLGIGATPLIVIHGQNMTGKTTIANSIRWALYGKAKGRGKGELLKTRRLINDDAYGDGERFVAVSLTIRLRKGDREQTYVLSRRHQIKASHVSGEDDSHYEVIKEIKRDGHVLSPTDFDAAVNQSILPEEISRFFLFDGELLNEYEDLVREGGEVASRGVKESIELILGVPTARSGRDDIRELKRKAENRLNRVVKEANIAEDARREVERLDVEHCQFVESVAASKRELSDAHDAVRDVEEQLKLYDESREEIGRLERAREDLKRTEVDQERTKEHLRVRVAELWRDVLSQKLKAEIVRLREELVRRQDARDEVQRSELWVLRLQQSLDDGKCSECGQDLPMEQRAKTRAEITKLNSRIDEIREIANERRISELHRVIGQLEQVAPAGVLEAVKVYEDQLNQLRVRINRHRNEIGRSEKMLKDIDVAPMHEYDERKRQLDELVAKARHAIGGLEEQMAENRRKHAAAQAVLLQSEDKRIKRLRKELESLDALEEIFSSAVDEFAQELREEVQTQATDVFRQLTTEASYAGLEINDRYGLTIIREDGTPAIQRSAGAEQVVALSLLGALNRLAVMRGPVIMDTPFGRLDRGHRSNILQYVSQMADQAVLLVHDGEVDPERDLAPIRGQIDAEYEIEHPTPSSSSLRRMTVETYA
jgi:DNA sulfur modification protein DndD